MSVKTVDFSFANEFDPPRFDQEWRDSWLEERFCDMDAQPNSVGRLAHLTDDEILDRFDRKLHCSE